MYAFVNSSFVISGVILVFLLFARGLKSSKTGDWFCSFQNMNIIKYILVMLRRKWVINIVFLVRILLDRSFYGLQIGWHILHILHTSILPLTVEASLAQSSLEQVAFTLYDIV